MATLEELVGDYLGGVEELRRAVAGLSREQAVSRPVPGTWSTLEVVCHLANSEAVFADRMKRIIAEDRPLLPFADPKLFSASLAYQDRDLGEELASVEATRRQLARILRSLGPGVLARTGVHGRDGPCTLEQVLAKSVSHLRHHLAFVHEKRRALGIG
jgi:hypothetical protein